MEIVQATDISSFDSVMTNTSPTSSTPQSLEAYAAIVDQTDDYGQVHIYSIKRSQASQVDMLISTFDNKIDVDTEFQPPEPDVECELATNFIYCINGKYYGPSTTY